MNSKTFAIEDMHICKFCVLKIVGKIKLVKSRQLSSKRKNPVLSGEDGQHFLTYKISVFQTQEVPVFARYYIGNSILILLSY